MSLELWIKSNMGMANLFTFETYVAILYGAKVDFKKFKFGDYLAIFCVIHSIIIMIHIAKVAFQTRCT